MSEALFHIIQLDDGHGCWHLTRADCIELCYEEGNPPRLAIEVDTEEWYERIEAAQVAWSYDEHLCARCETIAHAEHIQTCDACWEHHLVQMLSKTDSDFDS